MIPAALPIQPPRTPAEWAAYYLLRYAVLRQPWQQPPGSARAPADDEPTTIHALLLADAAGPPAALAVGMLQPTGNGQGQIRFMAVAPEAVGIGVGRQIVNYLEAQAKTVGISEIVLHSREAAVGFYERLGYATVEPSHLLFGEIQHFLMRKQLDDVPWTL